MDDEPKLTSVAKDIVDLGNQVSQDYNEFLAVMQNSNRFIQAVRSSSTTTALYNNFKSLTTNSNVSIVQAYEIVDTLVDSFTISYNNVTLKNYNLTKNIRLNSGTEITFGIYDNPKVFRSSNGRVALFDRQTGLALKHNGASPVTLAQFVEGNWNFSWCIYKTASGKYELQNDWNRGWNTTCMTYKSATDTFVMTTLYDPLRAKFTFGSGISQEFLTPSKDGLYVRYINGYFADNLPFVSTTAAVNTPYLETMGPNIANIESGSGMTVPINVNDNFTLVWTGYFYAPVSGKYTFKLSSDDASYMWLGSNALSGNTVQNANINNAGIHAMKVKSADITLTSETYYPLLIIYGDFKTTNNIVFSWKPPNLPETSTQTGYLFLNAPAA
jgi:hypothetical protein